MRTNNRSRELLLLGCAALLGWSCKDPTIGSGFNKPIGPTNVVFGMLGEDCPAGDDWLPPDGYAIMGHGLHESVLKNRPR